MHLSLASKKSLPFCHLKILQGLSQFPTPKQWGECVLLAIVFGLCVWLIMPELIDLNSKPNLRAVIPVAAIAFVMPAFCEEVLFRGLLIPRFQPIWMVLSLGLFVLWHPLEAYLFLPKAIDLFTTNRFLIIVGLLGSLCSWAYWRTKSLWASIGIHWLVVVIWKTFGGGGFIF